MDVRDGVGGDGEVLQWVVEVLAWVVEGLVREIIAGSLGLSESSEKTSHTVSHSFSNSLLIRGAAGVGDVSWVKSQRSMSSISSFVR